MSPDTLNVKVRRRSFGLLDLNYINPCVRGSVSSSCTWSTSGSFNPKSEKEMGRTLCIWS